MSQFDVTAATSRSGIAYANAQCDSMNRAAALGAACRLEAIIERDEALQVMAQVFDDNAAAIREAREARRKRA